MSEQIDISTVQQALDRTIDSSVTVSETTHLVDERILDSLDSAVFLLNIEKMTSVKINDRQLMDNDLYRVSNLVSFLQQQTHNS